MLRPELPLLLAIACGGDFTYSADAGVEAPDGRVRAVRFGAMAGGMGPVCHRGIVLLPAGTAAPTPEELESAEDSAVFVSSCYGRVQFRWSAADTLLVAYAPDSMRVSVRRRTSDGGRLQVVYDTLAR